MLHHLEEQLYFIKASSEAFDKGFLGEAKRLATTIRVLLHDNKTSSQSLLKQLDQKDKIKYYSVLENKDTDNAIIFVGLSSGFENGEFTYYPRLVSPVAKLDFQEWWNQPVLINKPQGLLFTRESIIRNVANTDGGAHVDPGLNEKYYELSRQNGFGWEFHDVEPPSEFKGPELSFTRQIAHELYMSITEQIRI
ncbi:hypothetical protein PM3016_1460 [Paenibacillus mucilaginosus 3016]|uniref:Uncharacterized protein n=1 Tax=Paenibacillus mucilaginosus 3016 TaxID=1116391 RepID=H6NGU3_9BACL|nr:hypothetical protein PM3016_1460 [Paenibacillus mucilaginosus 3016]